MQINKARLQVLQARDQLLDEILEETKRHLREAVTNEGSYQELLKSLILQVIRPCHIDSFIFPPSVCIV